MFSKTCEYGIRAVVFIAQNSEEELRVGLKDIAIAIDSPEAFTAKILQQLVRQNIIESQKGPFGGFSINSTKIGELTLKHIVQAIDGEEIYKGCGLGLNACDENHPCPVHERFVVVRDKLRIMLENTKINDLALGLIDGSTVLKR